MTTWGLELYDMAGAAVNVAPEYRSLRCSWVLNGPGAFEADLPWDAAVRSDWAAGEREIRIKRDGTRIWGGWLWRTQGSGRERTAGVTGEGYFSRLRRGLVVSDLIYTDVNQHQIAWNLIDHFQGQTDGDLGFTQGTNAGPNRQRDRDYCALERPNIGNEIELLAALDDGFDYEISPTKVFTTWSPQRGASSGITLTGSDELTLEWEEDATEALSYVTAMGEDECNPLLVDLSNAGAITRFKRLHEAVEARNNRKREVISTGNEVLRQRKHALFRCRATFDEEFGPAWGTYWLGDTVVVDVDDAFATFTKTLRIVEIALTLEDPDKAYVELVLDGATT